EGVDDDLIQSVVASLDSRSIDLHRLNECVTTLIAVTADEQSAEGVGSDMAVDPGNLAPHFPSPSGHLNGHLSDLEIAKKMAADPNYSPPRSSRPLPVSPS